MSERIKPTRNFCNLHSHTGLGSIFDAIDLPDKHMNSVYDNNVKFVVVSLHESSYPDYAFSLNTSIFKPFIALPRENPVLIAYFFNESR